MEAIFEHKGKIYYISGKVDDKYYIHKARWLPNGRKYWEELRSYQSDDIYEVRDLILNNMYDTFYNEKNN